MFKNIKVLLSISGSSFLILVLGALTTKIVAVTLGSTGIALYSQLRQVGQWFILLATLNGSASIIRLMAKAQKNNTKSITVFSIGKVVLFGIGLSIIIFFIFLSDINANLFDNVNNITIIYLAIMIFFGSFFSFVLSTINGLGATKEVIIIQLINSIIIVLCVYPMIKIFKFNFVIPILSIGFIAGIIYGIKIIKNMNILSSADILSYDYGIIKEHFSFSVILLSTGVIGATSQIALRTMYISQFGLEQAGMYDAAWNIGMMYIMLVLSSFGIYFIPKLSQLESNREIQQLVNNYFYIVILFATIAIIGMMIFKGFIIQMLYAEDFLKSKDILRWMIFGDFFKVTSWIFGAVLIGQGSKKLFLYTEIIFSIILVVLTIVFINYSFEAVGISFLIANIVYLIAVYIVVKKKYNIKIKKYNFLLWLIALALVMITGILTYND